MASTRDVIAGMFARRQIDNAMFQAARKYRALCEVAEWASSVRSVDIEAPNVQGSTRDYAAGIDKARVARHELQHIEAQIQDRYGEAGVELVRDVLERGITIENITKLRGDGDRGRAAAFWGGLFRRCLRHLAEVMGFAVRNAYENLRREDARQQWEVERQEVSARRKKKGGRRELADDAGI